MWIYIFTIVVLIFGWNLENYNCKCADPHANFLCILFVILQFKTSYDYY